MHADTDRWAVAVIRLFLGGMFLMAGSDKLFRTGVHNFMSYVHDLFAGTPLPELFLSAFGFVLPFVELTVGVLLLLGLYRKLAFVAVSVTLVFLSLGQFMLQEFNVAAYNAVYLALALGGLSLLREPCLALDSVLDSSR